MAIMKRFFIISSLLMMIISSCKKDEEILVDGNTAPPDYTIPNIVKENYVNKAYISVLGRKPISSELAAGLSILNKDNLSITTRNELLDTILSKPGYNERLYITNVNKLLNNLDTAQITQFIYVFAFLLTDPQYQSQWPQIQAEKTKLELLKASTNDLKNGTINTIGLHKRVINNYFYDQINMGSENFVNSAFQNFLYRNPTSIELDQGKLMVDGLQGILFLQIGKTKDDFLNIFFSSDNYYEGQVRDLYLKYLFRETTSTESATLANSYKISLNYKALQKSILTTDEYVGL